MNTINSLEPVQPVEQPPTLPQSALPPSLPPQPPAAATVFSPQPHPKRWLWIIGSLLLVIGLSVSILLWRQHHAQPTPTTPNSTSAPITVSLGGLASGQVLTAGTATITVTLSDTSRIQKVEYRLDDQFAGVTYAMPFNFRLDTAKLTPGQHSINALAYDKTGHSYQSTSLNFSYQPPETTSSTVPTLKTTPKTTRRTATQTPTAAPNSPPPDTTAPSVPTGLILSATDGYTTNLSWAGSSDNVAVTSYQILRDGAVLGTSTTTSYSDQTVVPGNTYSYSVSAVDAAANVSASSTQPSITLVPTSIWIDGDTPQAFDTDPTPIEAGVKFRPLVNGTITGVRFYKGALNTGSHAGHLWSSTGTQLASVTFSGETATGWQTAAFTTPVAVTAGTTYVVSYTAPSGHISYTSNYFDIAGITSQYLTALATGVDGNNGVFSTTTGAFPTSSFSNTNYWVDATFIPNPAAGGPAVTLADNTKVYPGYPGSNNTGVPVGKRLPIRNRAIDVHQDNTIIEDIDVHEIINVFADNVTIRRTRVDPPFSPNWAIRQDTSNTGLTVQDTSIFGDGTNQVTYGILDAGSGLTVTRTNIHTISDGIQANVGVTITDSFVHDLLYFSGDHNDSFISTGGDNITLTHNTFHNYLNQTAALGLFCDFAPITNVTATNNLLIGAGYSVYGGGSGVACAGSHDIKFLNNHISRAVWPNGGFNGPVTGFNGAQSGSQWSGNVWHEDGTIIP